MVITKRKIFDTALSFCIALLAVLSLRHFVVESFTIPSSSMSPTLIVGDHVFVSKLSYRKERNPERGDVAVFVYPKDQQTYYIKRIIGLPGDEVKIQKKNLVLNGKQILKIKVSEARRKEILNSLSGTRYQLQVLDVFEETLDGTTYATVEDRTNFTTSEFPSIIVPPDSYFVLGDFRDFSNDSRSWGFVHQKNLVGQALIIWASFWFHWQNFDGTFKFSRIGKRVI